MGHNYERSVFINCPFDENFTELFYGIVFTIHACGYVARSATEIDDSGRVRIEKIADIINECKFGIHDLSRTELDKATNLPRFNMPFELGMFLGAIKFGMGKNRDKSCLILDKNQYGYRKIYFGYCRTRYKGPQ